MVFQLHLTLLVSVYATFASAASFSVAQPGVNQAPRLLANFSEHTTYWRHSTPLLQKGGPTIQTHEQGVTNYGASSAHAFWKGWSSIKYVFAFGDSYTSTGFDASGQQPNTANPLGNPPYPGMTSSNGPNYIEFLVTTYNKSFVQAYNFGFGGSMIDNRIVGSPFGNIVKSFVDQINAEFQPVYTGASAHPWAMDNTLFIAFFGINDAINTFARPNNDSLQYAQIKSFENSLNQLYEAGARNFLILNLPPISRAPYTQSFSPVQKVALHNWIDRFHFRLNSVVWNLTKRWSDVIAFQFDTNALFNRVLSNPAQYPETAGYKNVTDFCSVYNNGAASMDAFDPTCGLAVDQYFWLNTLHPTYPMHNFLASQISQLLAT